MSSAGADSFNHALHTTNSWLADIGSSLGTSDRRFTRRAVRAWLHSLRDRLTVNVAAKFGAQLPTLLRGVYYDGWEPNKVPIKYGIDRYTERFAAEAGIPAVQVSTTAAAVSQVIADRMSPGQLAETLAELPSDLRATINGTASAAPPTGAAPPPSAAVDQFGPDRMDRIEGQIDALADAVRALAHGLEDGQLIGSGIDQTRISHAARLADEIVLASESSPATARASAEQAWIAEDLTVAEGHDPTPDNVERARRQLEREGGATIDKTVP